MNILLLGGSKFMGLELIESLINNVDNNIYVINRGKRYWNNEFYKIIKDRNNIFHFKSDRESTTEFVNTLEKLKVHLRESNNKNKIFNFIIDFSCFELYQTNDLLLPLNNLFEHYIFISSDSTYNASEVFLQRKEKYFFTKMFHEIEYITEEMAIFPENLDQRKYLKKLDSYGYNKLKCENVFIFI